MAQTILLQVFMNKVITDQKWGSVKTPRRCIPMLLKATAPKEWGPFESKRAGPSWSVQFASDYLRWQ